MVRIYDYNWLVKYYTERELSIVSPSFHGTLLDVGSSNRPYVDICGPYVSRYVTLDISPNSDIDVRADAMRLPFRNETIDVVLCFDVLYFLTEPWEAFTEFTRVLKPGGILVVFASQSWRTMDEHGDYYRFTKNGLSYLAKRSGLTVLRARPLDGLWAKMGAQINYFFLRFNKRCGVCTPLFSAIYLMNNGIFYLLNKIHNIDVETINNVLIAVKLPNAEKKNQRTPGRGAVSRR
jgi:SAM-dependent methyltransferase